MVVVVGGFDICNYARLGPLNRRGPLNEQNINDDIQQQSVGAICIVVDVVRFISKFCNLLTMLCADRTLVEFS